MAGAFGGLLEPDLPVDEEVTAEMEAAFDALGDDDQPVAAVDEGPGDLGDDGDDAGDAAAARTETDGDATTEPAESTEGKEGQEETGKESAEKKDVGDGTPDADLLSRALARGAELLVGDLGTDGKGTEGQAGSAPEGQGAGQKESAPENAEKKDTGGEGNGEAPAKLTFADLLPEAMELNGERLSRAEVVDRFGDELGEVLAEASVAAARRVTAEALAQFKAQAPAPAGAVSAKKAQALQARVEELDGMVRYEGFLRTVARDTEHKDVAAIVENPAWDAWVEGQAPAVKRLVQSGNVEDADLALKLYKASSAKAASAAMDTAAATAHAAEVALHSSTLGGADTPQSGGALSESEQWKQGWALPDPDDAS